MGLINNVKNKAEPVKSETSEYELTFTEVDSILKALATSHFPVKDIESLYAAIYKLQELRNYLGVNRNAT